MANHYIKTANVKKLIKENDRRSSPDFLHVLDVKVEEMILKCCKTWNGHKKTLNANLAKIILK